MAFHFEPPPLDSSEDDEVDISVWKSGATQTTKRKVNANPRPNGAASSQLLADLADTVQEPGTRDRSGEASSRQASEYATPPLQRTTSGFTSINRSAAESNGPSSARPSRPTPAQSKGGTFVPVIPVVDTSQLDFVDFTAGGDTVKQVLREFVRDEEELYRVEFEDYSVQEINIDQLLALENGHSALQQFSQEPNNMASSSESEASPQKPRGPARRTTRRKPQNDGFVSTIDAVPGDGLPSDDEDRGVRTRRRAQAENTQYIDQPEADQNDEEEEDAASSEDDDRIRRTRTSARTRANGRRSTRPTRGSSQHVMAEDSDSDSSGDDLLRSDLFANPRKRKSSAAAKTQERIKKQRVGERQSGRSTRHQGAMQEVEMEDIYRSDSDSETKAPVKPKVTTTKEVFQNLPRNDDFRMRHLQNCEICGEGSSVFPLVYCQGCILAYHKNCLGSRSTREHLVTKVDTDDFVLQCRRCIGMPRKKEPTAPDHGQCQDCGKHGNACQPFRPRKTTAQEMKEREDNDGEDPIYEVHPSRINQAENVLFRCLTCWRGFHFEHLPSRSDIMDLDPEADADQRFREYSRDWQCKECLNAPAKVSGLIAWKPVDEDSYDPGLSFEEISESDKAYLVKWEGMSYFRALWMPGAWVWGTTTHMMRKAFAKREDSRHPKMRTEDAIPEDFLRADIVLDIKYTSIVDIQTLEVDKARIREIDKALIKYKGLGYEDAVWEAPPSPEDGERWADFVTAYNDWVLGRYVRQPKSSTLKTRLEKARKEDFSKLEKQSQPDNMEGGQLMNYQIEGLNWLYYKWFTRSNAILADEMGLGKTIQIIGFLATLVQDWNCYPFLIVVPNSTCPNWRREIKRWAPSLRVVAYYGSKESRDLAYKHELFPNGSKDVRCHVVVTSYDATADDNCRKFFRSVAWQGLVVDEGQRLKNDRNLLYSALTALKVPFKILLTGTPLQNNQRELFNLLQFIDETFDAASLEEEYQELDHAKIEKLHELIRPFFLRRTKTQVLTFLPPMAQIIVPVSMTLLQKKVYRSILAKNPDLMKAIFTSDGSVKPSERGSLSNILMQLRKCLCHPFVYSRGIEEKNVSISASHRNLVDASSKLALLELLLPKLKERGHRVLIFSQFLDMLDIVEDFLDGMEMKFARLDGSISALQKQKRIDEFNAPESPLFAFLLSTRAGGVGINLATADTVIILDPDFNPHQDIQALSRAHRIGQSKKVLCFQLVTRASAEERIMQIGRKKLALDHVLIQEMDADDADQNDLASILRHGASELFEDSGETDIAYDPTSVDRLLDRSHMEDTRSGTDKSAETQFSFARVWANDSAALQDADAGITTEEQAPDPGVWANILKERERVAAEEAAARAEAFGRGRRARNNNIDYAGDKPDGTDGMDISPIKVRKTKNSDESDTDFQADDSDDDDDHAEAAMDDNEMRDLDENADKNNRRKSGKPKTPKKKQPTPVASKNPPKKSPSVGKSPAKITKKSKPAASNVALAIKNALTVKPKPSPRKTPSKAKASPKTPKTPSKTAVKTPAKTPRKTPAKKPKASTPTKKTSSVPQDTSMVIDLGDDSDEQQPAKPLSAFDFQRATNNESPANDSVMNSSGIPTSDDTGASERIE